MRATLIISIAIPVSVIGAFVAMALLGRSLNVISLAGIAFSVGMVVDAAIVVLENIYRYREKGEPANRAAFLGASQVWGAILASALTTVAVFAPLLILQLQAGQLFRDIAVAISVSVLLSLVVSITVIPVLAKTLLSRDDEKKIYSRVKIPIIDPLATAFVNGTLALISKIISQKPLAFFLAILICGITGFGTIYMLPKLDYLPDGNRNFIFGRIQPPSGFNLATTASVAKRIENEVKPLWSRVSGADSKPGDPPKIANFFFLAFRNFTLVGASAVDSSRAGELVPVLRQTIFKEPGMRGIIAQSSIFGRQIGGSRVINLNISGDNLDTILEISREADRMVRIAFPRREGNQVRPRPGLETDAPEVRVLPNLQRLAAAGLTAKDLGQTIDTLNDGTKILEINVGSKRLDLVLKGPEQAIRTTQGISSLPIVTATGIIVSADSLADIQVTVGPSEIRHMERARTVTLQIRPAKQIPLETAIGILQAEVIDKLRSKVLPEGIKLTLSGAAGDLTKTWNTMKLNLFVALVIVYLVLAVLFESLLFPLIILLSVPLATAGGVAGLRLLNTSVAQPLDMMTMLGFVILIGIVVNNAILLVDQTLQHLRQDGLAPREAILAATRSRMRPIFMSTLTSVFGLLPLVIFSGAGSELYRGLGSVVVGGLTLSALLTLAIIPLLLAVLLKPPVKTELG
jgi:HAE1 family hydrophobic/amphiphilic exporter-1